MRQLWLLVWLLVLSAGCTSDSTFPDPTGKGTVRAINAIKGSPDISFRIEETVLDSLSYKGSSASRRWDDFEYTFNFDVFILGETELRRVARPILKVDADRDYTLVLSGNVLSPAVDVWEAPERTFTDTETALELRFAHTAASLSEIDVYFAAPGTMPVVGEERSTLAFGDSSDPFDIESGDYVLTVTSANDPADVLFESGAISYASRNAFIAAIFDSDEADVAPFTIRLINTGTGLSSLADVRFSPTVRFIQASLDLPPSDVYDDELLMNQVLSNHLFGDITGDLDIAIGTTDLTYTAVGNTSAIQLEDDITVAAGTHSNFIAVGEEGSRAAAAFVPDRRSISTVVKLQVFHAALRHPTLDFYLIDADESLDDATRLGVLGYAQAPTSTIVEAGSYDIYLTLPDEKTILSGPNRLDVQLGDVIESVILDTIDPATAEFRVLPSP